MNNSESRLDKFLNSSYKKEDEKEDFTIFGRNVSEFVLTEFGTIADGLVTISKIGSEE